MENITTIAGLAIQLGFTPLNLVLGAMLYFMGAKTGIFPKFWGESTTEDNQPATKKQMNRLSQYYNHDTTELLTQIREHLSDVKDETKTINSNLAILSQTTNRLENTIREWEKYGVPNKK